MKNNYSFSLIVPLYNMEEYIIECLDSIYAQSYKNYEVIIVDDGSTDNSKKLVENYIKNKNNFKIFSQTNGGPAKARNNGVKNAKGDYIIFIDSDDILLGTNALLSINNKLQKNCDVLVYNYKKMYKTNELSNQRYSINEDEINSLSSEEMKNIVVNNNVFKSCACDKVVNREFILKNSIFFKENINPEDLGWSALILEFAKKIIIINDSIYAYRQRSNSRSSNGYTWSDKHYEGMLEQLKYYFNTDNQYLKNFYSYEYVILLSFIYHAKTKYKEETKSIIKILNTHEIKKVKLVYYFYKIFGFKLTTFVLNTIIKMKNRRKS